MTNRPKSFFQKLVNKSELKFNRKLGIYLVCLVLACILWLLITLSEKYETDIMFPVTYSGVPADKVVTSELPESISARVNAVGFSLLLYKIKGKGENLSVSINPSRLRGRNGNYYTLPNSRLDNISAQLGDKIKILKIAPDTIYVSFTDKMERKLTVKPDLDITIAKQHGLADSIKSEPQKVTVTGPKYLVEKMEFARTEKISMKDVDSKQVLTVGFKSNDKTGLLKFNPEKVKVNIPVEKYTEGSKEVSITVRNLPKGHKLKVYPEKVKVIYQVGLSNYDKVTADMFAIGFNYKNLEKKKGNKMKVEVLNAPAYVNAVRVEPVSVEYIIQK